VIKQQGRHFYYKLEVIKHERDK